MRSILLFGVLMAVATPAIGKHVYPQHLSPSDEAAYVLAADHVYKEKAATFTVHAGDYVQRYEDSKAVYLIGESNCADMNVVPPKQPEHAYTQAFNCGIYLPKDPAKGAAFFFIRGEARNARSGAGAVVDAIIKAGEGSFDFPTSKRDDVELRRKLARKQPVSGG